MNPESEIAAVDFKRLQWMKEREELGVKIGHAEQWLAVERLKLLLIPTCKNAVKLNQKRRRNRK